MYFIHFDWPKLFRFLVVTGYIPCEFHKSFDVLKRFSKLLLIKPMFLICCPTCCSKWCLGFVAVDIQKYSSQKNMFVHLLKKMLSLKMKAV
jgi:hypothetical protein